MSYVILDLEWNASYSRLLRKFVNEIIEFGAVKVDDELNITDKFSVLVSPKISKKLCSKVRELTKITNEDLINRGVGFIEAVSMFTEFLGDSVMLTWSDSDLHALCENYSYYTGDVKVPFLKRYCNLQAYCESCLDLHDSSAQLGLSACAGLLNIDFSQEEQHRAFADAYLSLKCLEHFKNKYPLEPFIVKADNAEFYNKLLFKNHFITDISSPEVNLDAVEFTCPDCGGRVERTAKWRLHNKSFAADFLCPNCDKRFVGRVSYKKTYNSVIVRQKLNIKREKQNKAPKDTSVNSREHNI